MLDAAKADLELGKLTLQWCSITSPIDGILVKLLARQGQFFDRAVSLATVIDLSAVFVQLSVPARDFVQVQRGASVEVHLNSISRHEFHGGVERISGQADPLTGDVTVFAIVENKDGLLRPGLGCNVRVSLPEIRNSLAVPLAAVADDSGTPVVTVIRAGKAYETEVQTGIQTQDLVQLLGGVGLPKGYPVQIVDHAAEISTVDHGP